MESLKAQDADSDTGFQALACDESCELLPSDFQSTPDNDASAVIGTMVPGQYEMIISYKTRGTVGVPFNFEINQGESGELFLFPALDLTTEHTEIALEPGLNEVLIQRGDKDLEIKKIELIRIR